MSNPVFDDLCSPASEPPPTALCRLLDPPVCRFCGDLMHEEPEFERVCRSCERWLCGSCGVRLAEDEPASGEDVECEECKRRAALESQRANLEKVNYEN